MGFIDVRVGVVLLLSVGCSSPPPQCPEGMARIPGARWGDFCLDITEVTVAAFNRPDEFYGHCLLLDPQPDHPATCVDWSDAAAHCRGVGKRLPTEEEWEWAARGPKRSAYAWGSGEPDESRACWSYGESRRNGPCAVGSHPLGASPQGVEDLMGNAEEWTASVDEARRGRVTRGGGWGEIDSDRLRASSRFVWSPGERFAFLGFRCAKSL